MARYDKKNFKKGYSTRKFTPEDKRKARLGASGNLSLIVSGGGTALAKGARIVKGLIKKKLTNKMKKPKMKRPKKGLLGGTICPPSSDWNQNVFPTPNPPFKGDWKFLIESIFHSFTHFELELKIMISKVKNFPPNVYLEPLNNYTLNSLPTVMKKGVEMGIASFND